MLVVRRSIGKLRRSLAVALLALGGLALWAPAGHAAFLPANADFNDDGFSDLAVGAPVDSVQGQDGAGAVNVLYGGARGLSTRGEQQFTQATPGIGDVPEQDDFFGGALAAGDFNGDGIGDLAIGVPGEGVPTGDGTNRAAAGMVHVLYGSRDGLRVAGSDAWTQDSPGIKGVTEARDGFGTALAVGNFDGDREDDLGIGVPGEGVSGQQAAGAVNVLYGTRGGLSEARDQLWTQNTSGIKGVAGSGFQMGTALAANDVSGNNRDELAIGIPGGRVSGHSDAGAVLVLYGRARGLTSVDDLWSQDARGIKGVSEAGDHFGNALAIGDFDRDRVGDLAVGVPEEGVGGASDAGAVNVIYGSQTGLREDPDQLWTQNSRGIKGVSRPNEHFGVALVAVDFSRNVADDLAIGVPNDDISGRPDAGAVNVLYGKRGGVSVSAPTSCGRRTAAASRPSAAPATTSARHSPPATSTPTTISTWSSGCRARRSPGGAARERSTFCSDPPPVSGPIPTNSGRRAAPACRVRSAPTTSGRRWPAEAADGARAPLSGPAAGAGRRCALRRTGSPQRSTPTRSAAGGRTSTPGVRCDTAVSTSSHVNGVETVGNGMARAATTGPRWTAAKRSGASRRARVRGAPTPRCGRSRLRGSSAASRAAVAGKPLRGRERPAGCQPGEVVQAA
jgi:hypothetical protein